MLDGKVLAAVFASIAAIAAGMNGGGLSPEEVKSSSLSAPGKFSYNDLVPDSIADSLGLFQRPEPENEVRAFLELEEMSGEIIKARDSRLVVTNLTSASVMGGRFRSDEELEFTGFSGSIDPGEPTKVAGRAEGIYSSGVNVSRRMELEREVQTSQVVLRGVEKSELRFSGAKGYIKSNSSVTEINSVSGFSIDSFSGDITVWPRNASLVVEGRVNKLTAGEFRFGAN